MDPLTLGIFAVLAYVAGVGLENGVEGADDRRTARGIKELAESEYQAEKALFEECKASLNTTVRRYGEQLAQIAAGTVQDTVDLLRRIGQQTEVDPIDYRLEVGISVAEVEELSKLAHVSQLLLSGSTGVAKSIAAGVSARSAVTVLVSAFGTAGTGAAISELSGVAATNATLAWIGGGTLASGGGGMAAGSMVLGGLTIAPAILVGGYVFAANGKKELTRARSYESEVTQAIATNQAKRELMERVQERVDELEGVVTRLDDDASTLLGELRDVRFRRDNASHMAKLTMLLQLVRAIREVMSVPIVTDDNQVSEESSRLLEQYNE